MNPFLSREFLIPFNAISAEHLAPALREAVASAEQELAAITEPKVRSYANTFGALETMQEKLGRTVRLAYHMTSVANTPDMRAAFNEALPEFSAFYAKMPLNGALWEAVKSFAETEEAAALEGVYKRNLEKTLKEFKRAGADLPAEKKARAEAIKVELSKLQTKFSENVLDATNSYELLVTDEAELAGLPDSAKKQAAADARAKAKDGYRFTLQIPSYLPFMKYANTRDLRRQLYTAYNNRASEGELDNAPLIGRILALRQELAELLGYANFADMRLEENMVGSGTAALEFERDLYQATLPYWQNEVAALEAFARDTLALDTLEPWDVAYVSEKQRQALYDFDEEALRPYLPLDRVLSGMYELAGRLFGITISKITNPKVWHDEVDYYEVHNAAGQQIGAFYTDWFPRESKRGGAWMNGLITGGPTQDGGFEPHLGLMCANFTPPQDGKPALLNHREVQTVFHEFGHLLHHLLSTVEVRERAGTHVAWDWVELPSQIMENWTWEKDALDLFARHTDTGEAIPDALFERMINARTFMEANGQMRQLSFGTVDLELHINYSPTRHGEVVAYGQQIMEPFSIRPEFAHTNFLTAFAHVFSGAYAAGYYSYKWSEVLDADAFSRFKAEGIFNPDTGRDFVNAVLSRGDSADPADLFREFMGREPDVNALLTRNLGLDTLATGTSKLNHVAGGVR